MHPSSDNHIQRLFGERVRSLLEDGFCLRVKSVSPTLLYAYLVHRFNGNHIKLYARPMAGTIEQYTNGLLKFLHVE